MLKFAKLWKPVEPVAAPPRQGYISPDLLEELQAYSDSLDKTKVNEFLDMYRARTNSQQ